MASTNQSPEQVVRRILARGTDTITDGETGKRGVIIRPDDVNVTIMDDLETGKQTVVIWTTLPSN